jgi:quercetin dioxygenase-like cupin family protein
MTSQREQVDLDRRALLELGLAGATALVLGTGRHVLAGEATGVERKVLKEVDSNIPGYAKIRVRDVIFQPGASTPTNTMENDMVCETTEGTLEVTKDGQTFTAPKGTVWTCRKGGTELTANKGTTVAIMHVIDLLPT